ncbi:hypothetical protein [Aureivirga sp. CE67]|uniref:hypothetical protein n=1 Tax=Aureivirga sp. CE67 TaxID=1788983 RepID=UPI0018CA3104|nr:hypothetical protein [Aureivirga sp. CE67]
MSKKYTTPAYFDIKYINLPKEKELSSYSNKQLHVLIQGTGFNLLKYKFTTPTLKVDLNDIQVLGKNKYFYLPKSHFVKIEDQLDKNTNLQKIYTDSIFIQLNKNISRKIPVIADVNFQFETGINIKGKYELIPDSVTVMGSSNALQNLNEIHTEKVEIQHISSNIEKLLPLKIPENIKNVNFSEKEVVLKAEVLKYTEATVEVDFEVINLPKEDKIITFPNKVEIKCQVPIEKFKDLDKNLFKVECDYEYSKSQNLNYLLPKVIIKPKYINSVRIIPNKIEFLINK